MTWSSGTRVCVFGGSFDPPHVGHALAALWILSTRPVDRIAWVPTARHAFGKGLAPFSLRVAASRLATRHLAGVDVVEIEAELPGVSRTIDTVDALAAANPGVEWSLAFGSDLEAEVRRFKRWDELAARCRVHFVPRGAGRHGLAIPDVSSTWCRGRIAASEWDALSGWVDGAVIALLRAERHRWIQPESGP